MVLAPRKISLIIGLVRVPWRTVQILVHLSQWPIVVLVSKTRYSQPTKWKNISRLKRLKRRVLLPQQQRPKVQLRLHRRRRFLKSSANPLISIQFQINTPTRSSNQCRCPKTRSIPYSRSQNNRYHSHQPLNSRVKPHRSSRTPRRKTPRFRPRKANSIIRPMPKKTAKPGPSRESLKMPRLSSWTKRTSVLTRRIKSTKSSRK